MKSAFLDKLIERLDRLGPESLQSQFLRLAREKGLMETVFQAIQEGIIVLDSDGRIAYVNKSAERMMGVAQDSALGRPISRYLREIEWDRIIGLDTGEWSKMLESEVEVNYPNRRFLRFYVVPLSTGEMGGAKNGVLVMLRDVTERREEEANMLETERLDAVKLLAAGVAHEIGNPLNALSIHLQLVDRRVERLPENDREGIRQLLDVARKEVTRLDMIITQFLRAIRPSRPNLQAERIEIVLQETLALLKQEIENRRIRVRIERPGPMPAIPVDVQQMKQAFFNIVRNSLQATADGGALDIDLSTTDRFLSVTFRDTGRGISQENLGHIFEPYFTTKEDGSGLGLMVVQRIVQDHGGAIEVHSEPGSGTTFTVLLPLVERQMRLLKPGLAEKEGGEE